MNLRYKFLILLVVLFILFRVFRYYSISSDEKIVINNSVGNDQVKVSVYYEALCPDSKFFILHQLVPVYKELRPHMILDLVPYGKAETFEDNENIQFNCQHGEVECYANKIHSCVINQVKEPSTQLKYISCMIDDNANPDEAGERCGSELNISYQPIKKCATSKEGSILLRTSGDRTNTLKPKVKFIPTIELNESQNFIPQPHILKNLLKSICKLLSVKPKEC